MEKGREEYNEYREVSFKSKICKFCKLCDHSMLGLMYNTTIMCTLCVEKFYGKEFNAFSRKS